MSIAAKDAAGTNFQLASTTTPLGELPSSSPADPSTGEPFKASSETTLLALNVIAQAMRVAVEALNSKTTAVNTSAIAGTVALDGSTLAALESITAATGGLTNSELRASPVPFAGTITSPPGSAEAGAVVRQAPVDIWVCSFAAVASSLASADFTQRRQGTGVGVSQAGGNLLVTTGTTTNAEFLARSVRSFNGAMIARAQSTLSQRIANQNFAFLLADLFGESLAYTINSATSISVTLAGHSLTAQNVGQFMFVGAINGAAGVPGRYAIASIPDANTINFTVAGWPASGSGTLDLFGWNHYKVLYSGTTATAAAFDAQRRGWASGDTTLTINTTAAPGHIVNLANDGRSAYAADMLAASSATPAITTRGSRYANLPDADVELYVYLWSYNGTTAPASTSTWTVGFVSVEDTTNNVVYLGGIRPQGQAAPLPVAVQNSLTLATNTPTLAAGTNRAGFVAGAGIWYDDTSTALGANGTFTGTSRDATLTATATAFANAATYAQEVVASAEQDVSFTLALEVSRDNTTWRRVKAAPSAAVSGGGHYAEIVHRPSWRYWRVLCINGAGAAARTTVGSIAKAI